MIVEFSVGNFLSFKDIKKFSFVGVSSEHEGQEYSFENVFYSPDRTKLLKSSIFYGANASGKSNFIKAFGFVTNFILKSFINEYDSNENITGLIPFLLNNKNIVEPSHFEIIFFIGDTRFRYGFELDKYKIHSEWLFSLTNSSRETMLFTRTLEEGILTNKNRKFKEGENKDFQNATHQKSLFLSTLAHFNCEISRKIQDFFRDSVWVINGNDAFLMEKVGQLTIKKFIEEDRFKSQLIQFFKSIKIGFEDIEIKENVDNVQTFDREKILTGVLEKKFPIELVNEFKDSLNAVKQVQQKMQLLENQKNNESKKIELGFKHFQYDDIGNLIDSTILHWSLQSVGTQKLFRLFGLLIESIEKGKLLVIDEFDSSLHTLLTQELIKLFHTKTNKKGQLLIAVHDTNLLKKEIFRRDQIWFFEKEKNGSTDFYSLVQYKEFVRNDASFEKGYLEGRYGGIPYLGDLTQFLNDFVYEQETV
jgi:hypothetical protein